MEPRAARTIAEFVPALGTAYDRRPAVVLDDDTLTYRALEERSGALGRGLLGLGVGKGTRIGMVLGNGPDFAVWWAAISRIGAVCVPISTMSAPRELARIVRHGDLHALVVQRSVLGHDLADRLEAGLTELQDTDGPDLALTDAPFLRWIALVGDGPSRPWSRDEQWVLTGCHATAELLTAVEREVHPEDEAIIVYTSGQSAEPKGVVHTHGSVMTKVHYLRDMMQLDERTVERATMPFFWVGGLVMHLLSALETGAVVVCTPRTSFGAYEIIGNAAQGDEPIDVALGMKAEPSLGMTETFGMYAWGHEGKGGLSEIAAPMDFFQPDMEVKVVDERGRPVADGERGEIVVRGVCVTRRLQKVDRAEVFDADGFYRTGDEGLVDGDRIHFTGRLGDMVKTSGANVSPAEVERALLGLPEIEFATVVGVDDDRRGQVVAAAIVVRPDVELDLATIGDRLRSELAPYKLPRRYLVLSSMDAIPMTPSLKVSKRDLAALIARDAATPDPHPPEQSTS